MNVRNSEPREQEGSVGKLISSKMAFEVIPKRSYEISWNHNNAS